MPVPTVCSPNPAPLVWLKSRFGLLLKVLPKKVSCVWLEPTGVFRYWAGTEFL